ncbi:endo alpha-1,4 polygalactosaminidase [Mucilaginibacter conchicola]|uniref:Endo alpha-1,4 polygalactosaminidase n=1 Tax=Mucilaginibacter conchicola TaxID=2303333 RepID=A0A372NPB5_9SPHI|nr:endo alpha-1,4 polygalactosaminidase [Mucilaginibacter conchicola]RFZ90467.1 endo alpha-1,4 polygalactosaminidase [Mucilaginibacter conchicola]
MFNFRLAVIVIALLTFTTCKKNSNADESPNPNDPSTPPGGKTSWWQPKAGVSFDWELDDITANASFSGDVVDVDAFTTSAETVAALHAKGKKVIAYLSVGTLEDDRPDGSLLPAEVLGKKYTEWPHEKWIDIRQLDKIKPWLNSRINMILAKKFDAIEPDNLDGYTNTTGFPLTEQDARNYMDYLITLAHENGLGIGQKNIPEVSADYAAKFDWALTEDAFKQGWQLQLQSYIKLNKPVFAVEYTDVTSQSTFDNKYCPEAAKLGYTAIFKKRDLDAWVSKCR